MAKELSDDMIVDEIIEGTDHPVTYKGEICTTYKEYSDLLLMFEAKRRMPAYKDSFNLSVSSNGPTAVNFNFAVQNVVPQIQPPPAEEPQLPSVPISLDELESIEDNPPGDGDK